VTLRPPSEFCLTIGGRSDCEMQQVTQNRGKPVENSQKSCFCGIGENDSQLKTFGKAGVGRNTDRLFASRTQGLAIRQGVRIVNRDRRYQAECQTPALLHSNPV
jgi:hypothetical protein